LLTAIESVAHTSALRSGAAVVRVCATSFPVIANTSAAFAAARFFVGREDALA